jgi:hypothetical protein
MSPVEPPPASYFILPPIRGVVLLQLDSHLKYIPIVMATDRSAQRSYTLDETTLLVSSVFTKKGEHTVLDHTADADEEVFVASGYKQ